MPPQQTGLKSQILYFVLRSQMGVPGIFPQWILDHKIDPSIETSPNEKHTNFPELVQKKNADLFEQLCAGREKDETRGTSLAHLLQPEHLPPSTEQTSSFHDPIATPTRKNNALLRFSQTK